MLAKSFVDGALVKNGDDIGDDTGDDTGDDIGDITGDNILPASM